ncbi:MAG TPA: transglycosylase SLT domain-containing protein [Jatrophihabitantaceae bacterium]
MALADAVAALPGGGEFAALWTQVDGDPGAVGDLAGRLQATASKAQETARTISKAATEVGDAWHGTAAHAFSGYMNRFGSAGSALHAGMEHAATTLQQAATSVSSAKDQLNAIAGRILDAADEAAHLKSDPDTADQYDAVVRKLVGEGCAEAEPVVHKLVADLEHAASAVHAAMTAPAFLDLTAAKDTTYLPPPGKPIQWNPIPHGLDPGTSPAAAGSGASGATVTGGVGAPSSGGPPAAMPTGNVAQWIDQAKKLLEAQGVPASALNSADINMIIQHESSGNPHAQNNWDSNAAAGHPSKGLMQTIDSTFDQYALPGHKDVWNPVDNIVAGVRYAIARYGSLSNVPGVAAVNSGGSYVGY